MVGRPAGHAVGGRHRALRRGERHRYQRPARPRRRHRRHGHRRRRGRHRRHRGEHLRPAGAAARLGRHRRRRHLPGARVPRRRLQGGVHRSRRRLPDRVVERPARLRLRQPGGGHRRATHKRHRCRADPGGDHHRHRDGRSGPAGRHRGQRHRRIRCRRRGGGDRRRRLLHRHRPGRRLLPRPLLRPGAHLRFGVVRRRQRAESGHPRHAQRRTDGDRHRRGAATRRKHRRQGS